MKTPTKLLLAVCAAGVLASCSEKESPKEIIRPVKAMQVGSASSIDKAIFTGKAKATQEVEIAFEVPGRIVEFSAEVGDLVKEGDELARLDPRDFKNAVAVAQAELDRSEAARDRIKKAAESNAVSAQAVTDSEALARAAKASLDIAKKRLEDTAIKAPFAGRIVSKYVENFENVLMKQKVLRLLDMSQVEMVIDVPEKLIPNVPYVETIEVTFAPFPDQKISAKVKEVGSEASELTRTYPVTLIMDQPEGAKILPGMAGEAVATANLPADRLAAGIPILPAAIFSAGSGQESYVWTIDEGTGIVSKSKVTVDRLSSSGIVVTEGLEPGQWIAIAGLHSLTDGQKVRILNQD